MFQLSKIHPTQEQNAALATYPSGKPITMINILRFKEETETGEAGEAVYDRYGKNVFPLLQKHGAKVLFVGKVELTVIGETEDPPHRVLIVQYPDKQAFFAMATSPEYAAIANDRTISLEYGGLYLSQEMNLGG